MEKITFTRQEFYSLIWSTPLSQLARKYAISDNGLRKMCRKYQLPIPQNGYWQKLKFNKPVRAAKLPPFPMEKNAIELHLRDEGSPLNLDGSPETLLVRSIKSDPNAPLTVPEELVKPHLLVRETRKHWAEAKKKHKNDYTFKNPFPCLSISVAKGSRPRALRFFDTLIKLVEYRGHTVIVRGEATYAVIGEIELKLSLREASNRVQKNEYPWPTTELVPNGKLILKTGQYLWEKEWRDNKTLLETMLAKIMAKLETDAEKEVQWKEASRLASIKREEEEQVRRQQEALRRAEQEKVAALLRQAELYEKAQQIRRFIAAAQEKAIAEGAIAEEFEDWMLWANQKADGFDPLVKKPDASPGGTL